MADCTMMVNWGILPEFPDICINEFNLAHFDRSRAFFLTHVDEVEMIEKVLDLKFLQRLEMTHGNCQRLYMHEISYAYLNYTAIVKMGQKGAIAAKKLESLKKVGKIILLKKNIPVRLGFPREGTLIEVTALSSGSNPGSIMLLLERIDNQLNPETQRVLFTGRCRLGLKDLKYCQPLYESSGRLKKISKLYIDTTFCRDGIEELPVRRTIIEEANEAMSKRIQEDPSIKLQLTSKCDIENLHFLRCIYEETKEKVHVSAPLYKFIRTIPALASAGTTASGLQTQFHFHYGCDVRTEPECGREEDEAVEDVTLVGSIEEFNAETVDEFKGAYCGIYSSHLSKFELARMVNYLEVLPKNVVPLYVPHGMNIQEVEILIYLACIIVEEEPEELNIDYPSQFHDLTGCSTLYNVNYYKIQRPVFVHTERHHHNNIQHNYKIHPVNYFNNPIFNFKTLNI